MAEIGSNGTSVHHSEGDMAADEHPSLVATAKEIAAAQMAEASRIVDGGDEQVVSDEPVAKKARVADEQVEEKDFDKETQKALEEIDANQNEIDALNERKFKRHLYTQIKLQDNLVMQLFSLNLSLIIMVVSKFQRLVKKS